MARRPKFEYAQSDSDCFGGIIEHQSTYGSCSFIKEFKSEHNPLGVGYHMSNKKVPNPFFTGKRIGPAPALEVEPGPAFKTFEEALEYMEKLGYTFKLFRAVSGYK